MIGWGHAPRRPPVRPAVTASTKFAPAAVLLALAPLMATGAAAQDLGDIAAPKPVRPLDLPAGFAQQVVADGLDAAAGMCVLPDGRVLICEQTGALRVVRNGELLPEPALRLTNLDTLWERGLIGVTADPAFAENGYIYCVYVAKEPFTHHRVARFTLAGDAVAEGSETILLRGDDQATLGGGVPAGHQGGGIHFGPDGMLYAVFGEQTAGEPSQSLSTFQGKAIRIRADGSIPEDNPFFATSEGKYRAIYSYGLRNPFALSVSPDDELYVTDVGASNWEEVNVLKPGSNYGWPASEGPTADARFAGPAHAYGDGGARSISAGWWHTSDAFPDDRRGYFFTDYMQGWVRHLSPADPTVSVPFAAGLNGPVALATDADGSLLVLCRNAWVRDGTPAANTGTLHRVWYPARSGRPAPKLVLQPREETVLAGRPATFVVAAEPRRGQTLEYRWTVDGEPAGEGPSLSLERPTDGARVRCAVSGDGATVASRAARVTVVPARPASGGSFGMEEAGVVRFRLTGRGSKLLVAGREVAAVPPYAENNSAVGEVGLAAGGHSVAVVGAGSVEADRGDGFAAVSAGDELKTTGGAPLAATAFVPERIEDLPPRLSELGLFQDLATLSPAAGVVPYSTASPLWSDGALKRRWVILPAGAEVGFDAAEPWDYPAGTVFIKHFELGDETASQADRYRLETRLVRVDADGLGWAATYRWGEDQRDAELLGESGLTETIDFEAAGAMKSRTWTYPSRVACGQCHTEAAGFVLGAQAKQLHGPLVHDSPGGFFAEPPTSQIRAWADAGLFDREPSAEELEDAPKLVAVDDEAHSVAHRGRSYLDANCANCHRPGGARGGFDLRIQTPWEEAGLVNNSLFSADLGVSGAKVLVPGDPDRSMVWLRLARRGDRFAMPPVGSHDADPDAVRVVRDWIAGMRPAGVAANYSVPEDDAAGETDAAGTFLVPHRYERGPQENTFKNDMFRVNAPEASLDPEHGGRAEAHGNGLMLIDFPHDPRELAGVRLDVSIWCGHPGTADRAVTVNGRSTLPLPGPAGAGDEPQVGHVHKTFELKRTDVVNGWNALQFTCENGSSFWGHYVVDSATLSAVLKPDAKEIEEAGLAGFSVDLKQTRGPREYPRGTLPAGQVSLFPAAGERRWEPLIGRQVISAYYRGYDENGSGDGTVLEADWHGFEKDGEPVGVVGETTASSSGVVWDTSLLPAQDGMTFRVTTHFENGLVHESPPIPAPPIAHPDGVTVNLYGPESVPTPFWTRVGEKKSCVINIPHDPADVERAQLHVVLWDGEHGENADLVTLNGEILKDAIGPGDHETYYRVVEIPPGLLRRGPNEFAVRAETTHHGIEVLMPGPAIAVRVKK